ncbi:hypothetical protein VOLCADRAFT_89228, partial [Volvox carteri f. nagariensis]
TPLLMLSCFLPCTTTPLNPDTDPPRGPPHHQLEAYQATGTSPGRVLADAVRARLRGDGGEGLDATAAVPSGRATADGVPLGRREEERAPGGGACTRVAPRGDAESERVRHALEELGYGDAETPSSSPLTPPRQGQSDRSHGADYD